MKIKITDIDGNKFHFDRYGDRIPGHGHPWYIWDPESGGWMNVNLFTSNDSIIFNPPEWLTAYLADGSLPYYDGDHVCVMVLPYDNATCCYSQYIGHWS